MVATSAAIDAAQHNFLNSMFPEPCRFHRATCFVMRDHMCRMIFDRGAFARESVALNS